MVGLQAKVKNRRYGGSDSGSEDYEVDDNGLVERQMRELGVDVIMHPTMAEDLAIQRAATAAAGASPAAAVQAGSLQAPQRRRVLTDAQRLGVTGMPGADAMFDGGALGPAQRLKHAFKGPLSALGGDAALDAAMQQPGATASAMEAALSSMQASTTGTLPQALQGGDVGGDPGRPAKERAGKRRAAVLNHLVGDSGSESEDVWGSGGRGQHGGVRRSRMRSTGSEGAQQGPGVMGPAGEQMPSAGAIARENSQTQLLQEMLSRGHNGAGNHGPGLQGGPPGGAGGRDMQSAAGMLQAAQLSSTLSSTLAAQGLLGSMEMASGPGVRNFGLQGNRGALGSPGTAGGALPTAVNGLDGQARSMEAILADLTGQPEQPPSLNGLGESAQRDMRMQSQFGLLNQRPGQSGLSPELMTLQQSVGGQSMGLLEPQQGQAQGMGDGGRVDGEALLWANKRQRQMRGGEGDAPDALLMQQQQQQLQGGGAPSSGPASAAAIALCQQQLGLLGSRPLDLSLMGALGGLQAAQGAEPVSGLQTSQASNGLDGLLGMAGLNGAQRMADLPNMAGIGGLSGMGHIPGMQQMSQLGMGGGQSLSRLDLMGLSNGLGRGLGGGLGGGLGAGLGGGLGGGGLQSGLPTLQGMPQLGMGGVQQHPQQGMANPVGASGFAGGGQAPQGNLGAPHPVQQQPQQQVQQQQQLGGGGARDGSLAMLQALANGSWK